MRPTRYGSRIKNIINEVFNNYILEIFDSEISTEYKKIDSKVDIFKTTVYRFKTKSNTLYDLEFIHTKVMGDDIMDDDSKLYQHIKNGDIDKTFNSIDLAFTLTDRIINNDNISHEEYIENTFKNETIELIARINYLIKEFIKNNPNKNIFVVGKNTTISKLAIYKKLFNNIFSNDFKFTEGEHYGYREGALYFIKK